MVAFGAKLPGRIFPVTIAAGQGYLVHRHGWVCGTDGIVPTVGMQQTFRGGIYGGDGFILQRLEGEGQAWIELSGEIITYELAAGQTMLVHPGHVGLFEDRVSFTITRVPGIKNMVFGDDGFHLVALTGPGNIWLQSMPVPVLAQALEPYLRRRRRPPGGRRRRRRCARRDDRQEPLSRGTAEPASASRRAAQRTLERNASRSTMTRISLPAATSPALSDTERVKTRRRPSIRSSVASAQTMPPIPTGTRWSNCSRLATEVQLSGRWPSMARQLASSHRAMSRGVARTGTEPERKRLGGVGLGHLQFDSGGETGVWRHAGTIRDKADVGHLAPGGAARRLL